MATTTDSSGSIPAGTRSCYYRTSADGAGWGDPGQTGTRIVATDGTRFRHTPTTTVVDDGSATGKSVLVGQLYVIADDQVDPGNGTTLLTNSTGGTGAGPG